MARSFGEAVRINLLDPACLSTRLTRLLTSPTSLLNALAQLCLDAQGWLQSSTVVSACAMRPWTKKGVRCMLQHAAALALLYAEMEAVPQGDHGCLHWQMLATCASSHWVHTLLRFLYIALSRFLGSPRLKEFAFGCGYRFAELRCWNQIITKMQCNWVQCQYFFPPANSSWQIPSIRLERACSYHCFDYALGLLAQWTTSNCRFQSASVVCQISMLLAGSNVSGDQIRCSGSLLARTTWSKF